MKLVLAIIIFWGMRLFANDQLPDCLKTELQFLNAMAVEGLATNNNELQQACESHHKYLLNQRFDERMTESPELSKEDADQLKILLPQMVVHLKQSCQEFKIAFDNSLQIAGAKMKELQTADLTVVFENFLEKVKEINNFREQIADELAKIIESKPLVDEFNYNVKSFYKATKDLQKQIESRKNYYPTARAKRLKEGCISP